MTWIVVGTLAANLSLPANISEQCLYLIQEPPQVSAESIPEVRFELKADRLKPQIESLLFAHWDIQKVVWYADPHHVWPTDFELVERSWDVLLSKVLEPYQLRVAIHENRTAVVDYMPDAVSL
ncbi:MULTISPECIES: hypothetical protein [Gammaproteobacteria]|uniref:hypothetical protein n=1 Tax=Gammaproteobacteria TaxID=1236 RepID=UPI000DD077BA|nr:MULTISPECIES: hypothetical protein [Gammaproteobacteria]RTE86872.1 hypothetical protein DQX04_00310 [Aliidiomarina sp. B3213]TCZ93339.1 hypothetical protein EYQ95_04990 [Lysobacter sp. N42]